MLPVLSGRFAIAHGLSQLPCASSHVNVASSQVVSADCTIISTLVMEPVVIGLLVNEAILAVIYSASGDSDARGMPSINETLEVLFLLGDFFLEFK